MPQGERDEDDDGNGRAVAGYAGYRTRRQSLNNCS